MTMLARRATALLACSLSLHCGAATTPDGPEYPALVLPARLPAEPVARRAPGGSSSTAAAARPAQAAPRDAASHPTAGSGDGTTRHSADPTTPPAAEPPAASEPGQRSAHGDLPDPQPLSERAQWSYRITYDRGTVSAGVPELVCLPRPQPTARRIGRFAFELWLGRELVDRVRFDFPLLAAETPAPTSARPIHDTPRFAPGARVSVVLRVPASERATRASILDRATGEVLDVTWPPRAANGAPLARDCPAPPARR